MNVPNSTTTRRSFLSRLAVGSAAAVALPLAETPASILAANDVHDPETFPPYFAAGTLIEVASDYIGIHAPGYLPGLLRINLTPQSEICARGSCTADWTALQLGDRIESATIIGPDGVRQAHWLNANMVAGMGTISAINGMIITISPLMGYGWVRDLTVSRNTTIYGTHGPVKGGVDVLHVGDELQFTAMADDANPSTRNINGWALNLLYA